MDSAKSVSKVVAYQTNCSHAKWLLCAVMIAAADFIHTSIWDHDSVTHLQSHMSIYVNTHAPHLPIILDTGVATSLTPSLNSFFGPTHPCGVTELNGLTNSTNVVGKGMVEWTIQGLFGTI